MGRKELKLVIYDAKAGFRKNSENCIFGKKMSVLGICLAGDGQFFGCTGVIFDVP